MRRPVFALLAVAALVLVGVLGSDGAEAHSGHPPKKLFTDRWHPSFVNVSSLSTSYNDSSALECDGNYNVCAARWNPPIGASLNDWNSQPDKVRFVADGVFNPNEDVVIRVMDETPYGPGVLGIALTWKADGTFCYLNSCGGSYRWGEAWIGDDVHAGPFGTPAARQTTITHELGHLLSLRHESVNADESQRYPCGQDNTGPIPQSIMSYDCINPPVYPYNGAGLVNVQPWDVCGVNHAYPDPVYEWESCICYAPPSGPALAAGPPAYYNPVTPARVLDTRLGTGGFTGRLGYGCHINVQVTGVGGVPASGVTAVVLNATVAQPSRNSFLTVYPSNGGLPVASNLNFVAGQTVPNLVTVKVGPDGKVKVYNAGGQTHVIFDVVGYYSTTPAPTPPAFTAANPAAAGPLAFGMSAMSIDVKDAANANTANALGPLDTCARINENGVLDADEYLVDQLRIDVTAQGIPAFNDGGTPSVEGDDSGGMTGYQFDFNYPAAHFTVKSRITNPFFYKLASNSGSSVSTAASDPLPDGETDDLWSSEALDNASPTVSAPESGDGIIERLTIETDAAAAAGQYAVWLTNEGHKDASNTVFTPDMANIANIAVNQPCGATVTPGPTATASPTPVLTPTPTATPTPALTASATPTSTSGPTGPCQWTVVDSPSPAFDHLTAIEAVSPSDIWAVGSSQASGPPAPLIEHWDGSAWSVVPTPNLPQAGLFNLSAVSANDIWAIGQHHDGSGNTIPHIVHWDGSDWTVVLSPNPGPYSNNFIYDIEALSASDVWAVGASANTSGVPSSVIILHWDGIEWSTVPAPSPGSYNGLVGIDAVATDDIWAVGQTGTNPGAGGDVQTMIQHWDGSTWTVVPSPSSGYSTLGDVIAIASDDIWASGTYTPPGGHSQALFEHWDGTNWTIVPGPTGSPYMVPRGLAAVSTDDVWAVGWLSPNTSGTQAQNFIAHWDGNSWTKVPSPNTAESNNLEGVAAPSSGDVWAVGGDYDSATNAAHTVIQRCVPGSVTPTRTASPTPTRTPTATPSAQASATPTPSWTATPTASWTGTPTPTRTASPTPTATRTASPTATASPPPSGSGYYHPLPPSRILDTRTGIQGIQGKLGPGGTTDVPVTNIGGVPSQGSGVTAVVLNVTVTEPSAPSYLTVYPTGVSRPTASNLNFNPGQSVPNLVIVKVGDFGKVSVFNCCGFTHIIFDVVGWYGGPGTDGRVFRSLAPARILDTRIGLGWPGKLGHNGTANVDVTGVGGVPDGAKAVILNTTVTQPAAAGYLTVYPSDASSRPTASNLNFEPGQTVPNLVMVKVPPSGIVNVYNPVGQTDVIFDVVGYFE